MARQIHALNDRDLRRWCSAGTPITRADGQGLTFTLSAGGTASWTLRFRFGGRQRELTLGRYPDITLKTARVLAAEARAKIQQGTDPAAEKQARLTEQRQATTVSALADVWLNHAVRGRYKHPEVVERVFRRDIVPAIGKASPQDVTRAQLARLLAKINASGRPTVANDALRHLKAVFGYAEVLGLIETNPAEKLQVRDAGGKESARTRVLSESELRVLFHAVNKAGTSFGRDNHLSILLLVTLGCRKSELFGATWSEFDLDAGLWRIPGSRTKTSEARELPLPPQVMEWVQELKVRAAGSPWVFPARRASKRQGHVGPDTLWRALQALDHGLERFSVHDLRRTSRSLMAMLGVPFDVAEKIIGHKLPSVAAIYDRGDPTNAKRAALAKVAAKVVELETGQRDGNVVSMRAAGGAA